MVGCQRLPEVAQLVLFSPIWRPCCKENHVRVLPEAEVQYFLGNQLLPNDQFFLEARLVPVKVEEFVALVQDDVLRQHLVRVREDETEPSVARQSQVCDESEPVLGRVDVALDQTHVFLFLLVVAAAVSEHDDVLDEGRLPRRQSRFGRRRRRCVEVRRHRRWRKPVRRRGRTRRRSRRLHLGRVHRPTLADLAVDLHEVVEIEAVQSGAVADRHVPGRRVAYRLIHGKTSTALTDVYLGGTTTTAAASGRIRRGRVTARPRETRSKSQHLVVLRAQDVLLIPAIHPRTCRRPTVTFRYNVFNLFTLFYCVYICFYMILCVIAFYSIMDCVQLYMLLF